MTETLQQDFKLAMSRFATGVCVVTFVNEDLPERIDGVTISAFSSVSINPLKILFCLDNSAKSRDALYQQSRFGVSILSATQTALAYQFASPNREGLADKVRWLDGLPVVDGALSNLICTRGNHYVEGDHDIIMGDVKHIDNRIEPRDPLLYFQSKIIEDYRHEH